MDHRTTLCHPGRIFRRNVESRSSVWSLEDSLAPFVPPSRIISFILSSRLSNLGGRERALEVGELTYRVGVREVKDVYTRQELYDQCVENEDEVVVVVAPHSKTNLFQLWTDDCRRRQATAGWSFPNSFLVETTTKAVCPAARKCGLAYPKRRPSS